LSAIGHYKSLDKAIRESLWLEPERWAVGDHGRFILHEDGLELVKPIVTNRWTVARPIGYVRLSWYTHFVLNAMVHRESSKSN